MRSMLFVPGDSPKKMARGLECGADALILDLEDSVAPAAKADARAATAAFLAEHISRTDRPSLLVRVNALDSGLIDDDIAGLGPALPEAIMLPKAQGGADIQALHARLSVAEAEHGHTDGATAIHAIATETGRAMFALGTYRDSSPRLQGLTWGAEDLSADIGAETNRLPGAGATEPFRIARTMLLFAAADANVAAIDTVHVDFRDLDDLRDECATARRDGFTAKMAIHPAQVPVINETFTPTPDEIDLARRIINRFAEAGDVGVVAIDGKMYDRPHLRRAEGLLARARDAGLHIA